MFRSAPKKASSKLSQARDRILRARINQLSGHISGVKIVRRQWLRIQRGTSVIPLLLLECDNLMAPCYGVARL
jgi:hypothetical protein